ncbi:MAG TPA: DUF885 family protein, partial [Vicinamibacteria bacterium]|nr:DUF885 family protein [Vicinamibacteria bacterium]
MAPALARVALLLGALALGGSAVAQTSPAAPAPPVRPAWIAASDASAQVLLEVFARFSPEGAGQLGVPGLDEQVLDLQPQRYERSQAALKEAVAELGRRRASATEPLVRQDLDILIASAEERMKGDALSRKHELTYSDVPLTIFRGLRALLDDQVAAERRPAALVRLRKYVGDAPGTTPATVLAQDRMRERLGEASLLGPARVEVEKHLANSAFYLDGIGQLFEKYGIAGYEAPLARLRTQVEAYNDFVRREILPRARRDFRLPPELYAFGLEQYGVEMAPDALAERARVAFIEIRNEMHALAPLVARQKGLAVTDYRDLIRALKKDQIVGEAILAHYRQRMDAL